ncbi:PREDICTED: protein transport protein sec31-like, partial [Habropoda laboriosa]|uniref:protein transport protein sec31-like n=1 Tax=Habropoda laboriosa TaxID=597456 RepID=UPI00083D9A46
MNVKLVLVCTILVLFAFDGDAVKSSRRRTGSSGWGFSSRGTTPRPRYSQSSNHQAASQPSKNANRDFLKAEGGGATRPSGSQPGKVGWNVPDKKPPVTSTNTAAKPSAPVNEQLSKSSATNVQSSGYSPSGGYPRQPANNPYQTNASPNQAYNPSVGQGYNPSVGHGYNPPPGYYSPGVGGGHPPAYGAQPSYGGYNPGFGQPSYSPSMGQSPQTILVQGSKPGIGQLAKEAFVFAGVSAGVNAAVNRLIPGGIYGNRGSGGGGEAAVVSGVPQTQITYNNYYNNGTAPVGNPEQPAAAAAAPAPAAQPAAAANAEPPAVQPLAQPSSETPQAAQSNAGTNSAPPSNANTQDAAQNNPNPLGFVTSNEDIKKLTESLFEKEQNSAMKHITMNIQGQKKDDSIT